MKSLSKNLVNFKFDYTNTWHWLAIIIAVALLVFAGYCIVKGITWLTGGGLKSIDMFQNTSSQLQPIEPYKKFNTLKPTVLNTSHVPYNVYGFNWYNMFITDSMNTNNKYLLSSFYVGTNSKTISLTTTFSKTISNENKDDIFNTTEFANLVPYFDTFEIARTYEWQSGDVAPKVVAIENYTPGFVAFRPAVTDTVNNIEYTTLGDLYVSNSDYANFKNLVDLKTINKVNLVNDLVNPVTIKTVTGFDGYIRYNKSYLVSSDATTSVWNDDGSKGSYDHNIAGAPNYYSVLSKNNAQKTFNPVTQITLTTTPTKITVDADPRNKIYKLNTEKFKTLGSIKFQGKDFPALNRTPEQPCEVIIRVSNSADDGTTNYLAVSSTINPDNKSYNISITTDKKNKAAKFYVNYSIDKKKVIILTRIGSLPETQYNYVLGIDAINYDSNNPKAQVRMYPLSTPIDINVMDTQLIKPQELVYSTRNMLNQRLLYHNAGYPFYQFDISGANLSLDSVAGVYAESQKFLLDAEYTDLRFCNIKNIQNAVNSAFAFDLVNELPEVELVDDGNIEQLFTVVGTINKQQVVSNSVFIRNIKNNTGSVIYKILIVYDPANSANNGKYLDIIKSTNGFTFPITDKPAYFTIDSSSKQVMEKLANDVNGCAQITKFDGADSKVMLTQYMDPITTSEYSQELFKDRVFKLRPVGLGDNYMYLNSDSEPKIVYAKPAPGTKPIGESGSPKITVYGMQTGNPDNVILYIQQGSVMRYIYYIPGSNPTVLNTTTDFNKLNNVNTNPNTGPLRQYFENPGRFKLTPKAGSQPNTYNILVYMSNGDYIPLNDIELVDVPPPETTTTTTTIPETTTTTTTTIPETTTTTTIPETTTTTTIPETTTTTTIPDTTTTTTRYTASDTPAPTEAITTTTTQYVEPGVVIRANIGTGLNVN